MSIKTKIQNTNLKAKASYYQHKLELLSDILYLVPVQVSAKDFSEHSGDTKETVEYGSVIPLAGVITYPDEMIGTANILSGSAQTINTLRMNEDLPIKLRTFETLKMGDVIIDYVAQGDELEDLILTFLTVSGFTHDMKERTRSWKIYQLTQKFDFIKKAPKFFEADVKKYIIQSILGIKEG